MAALSRKDIRNAGATGDKIDKLIPIMVSKANTTRLDQDSFSLASMLAVLRAGTGNDNDTFATVALADFKVAFFPQSIPDNVVQEYLDICKGYEEIIVKIQTVAAGLPVNNV